MSHSDSEINKYKLDKKRKLHFPFKAKKLVKGFSKQQCDLLKKRLKGMRALNDVRLLQAVCTNNTEVIEKELELGANPNMLDTTGRGALHIAASKGYTEAVKILLDKGANPNQNDILSNTPLHLAACNHNLSIISMLIKAGADVQRLDMYGKNPVQIAESKLQLLHRSWQEGSIEALQVKKELELIVDILISVQSQSHHSQQTSLPDLEMMRLSLKSGDINKIDDQMCKLLNQLQDFKLQ